MREEREMYRRKRGRAKGMKRNMGKVDRGEGKELSTERRERRRKGDGKKIKINMMERRR